MAHPRLHVPGLSHHIRHRGNNRCDIFKDDRDRRRFLELLGKTAQERDVAIHGYALMTNHIHALVTGRREDSLPRMMQSLGRSYVRYFNERHRRTGTLWEGRYRAGLIVDERHWLTCLRYVELNALAARMVSRPEDYPWSSYHAHARNMGDGLLTPHPLYLQLGLDDRARSEVWTAFCGQPVDEAERREIREATRRGRAIGRLAGQESEDFDPDDDGGGEEGVIELL